MAEYAHAYLPPIEPRAQRPLWVVCDCGRCRLKALESRMGCELPATIIETLALHEFDHSAAYDRCRTEALDD